MKNIERRQRRLEDPIDIGVLVTRNIDWALKGEGEFKGEGWSPEELIGPSLKYLRSRIGASDAWTQSSYKAHLAEMTKRPQEALRDLFGRIHSEWQRNMP